MGRGEDSQREDKNLGVRKGKDLMREKNKLGERRRVKEKDSRREERRMETRIRLTLFVTKF